LLVGHGGLGLVVRKAEWYDFFLYFGVPHGAVDSSHLMTLFGWFEILLGLAVLIRPARRLLLFVLVWKLGTEYLRPLVGQEWFQFVERAGDYALPIGLYLLSQPVLEHGRPDLRTGATDEYAKPDAPGLTASEKP